MATWKQYYAPRIAQIINENKGKSVTELKNILQNANPGLLFIIPSRRFNDPLIPQAGNMAANAYLCSTIQFLEVVSKQLNFLNG